MPLAEVVCVLFGKVRAGRTCTSASQTPVIYMLLVGQDRFPGRLVSFQCETLTQKPVVWDESPCSCCVTRSSAAWLLSTGALPGTTDPEDIQDSSLPRLHVTSVPHDAWEGWSCRIQRGLSVPGLQASQRALNERGSEDSGFGRQATWWSREHHGMCDLPRQYRNTQCLLPPLHSGTGPRPFRFSSERPWKGGNTKWPSFESDWGMNEGKQDHSPQGCSVDLAHFE